MKYVKPDFEEIDLILEGSFLQDNSPYVNKGDKEVGGSSENEDEADSEWL